MMSDNVVSLPCMTKHDALKGVRDVTEQTADN